MVRDESDSWGVDESVGVTALGTAAVRAFESSRGNPLFVDPYSQLFLDAAAQRGQTSGFGGRKPEEFADSDQDLADFVETMTSFAAVRTKFFDDFFVDATAAGLRQFVILAAGLDTRAWRLAALAGSSVYEIDQPGVLAFKAGVLEAPDAIEYRAVPIDLREDWPTALRSAGLDVQQPTGWSIEGLLPYLPPDAQTALFGSVIGLSAPGSRVVVDAYRPEFYAESTLEHSFAQMDKAARVDGDDDRIYSKDLFFTGDRPDVVEWLNAQDWSTSSVPSVTAMAECGRPAAPTVRADSLSSDFVTATAAG